MQPYRLSGILSLVAAIALLPLPPAVSQTADCTYDRCALRLQYRFASTRLVQGLDATPVAGFGLFSSRIAVFEAGPDSVRRHYEAFRHLRNRGGVFQLLGLAAGAAGVVIYGADRYRHRDTALGFVLIGTSFSFVGAIHSRRSAEELQRAIWQYNRLLQPSN
jgi:hypothetical protein